MNLSTLKLTENLNNCGIINEISEDSIVNYKTRTYDANCKNEIQISNVIKHEMTSAINYNIINKFEFIDVKDINQKRIATHDILKYVLLYYQLDTSKYKPLNEFLTTVELPNRFLSSVLKIYSNLLICIQELEKIDICYFDLSAENILVDADCNVILNDFKHSLLCNFNNNFNYLFEKSVENLKDYTLKPIEIHLMHYLIKVNGNPLSYSSIDEIAMYYVENMRFLSHFPKEYTTNYYHESVAYLKKQFLHKSKEEILIVVREKWKTWDNFSLSVLFLHILDNAIQCFSLNGTIINEIVSVMKKNLNAVPNERNLLFATGEEVKNLFLKKKEWGFLHLIPKSKMKKFYEKL